MKLLGVRAHHYDRYGDVLFQDLPQELPVNVAASQPFEQVNLLARHRPDVYVGHMGGNVWAAKMGIPVLPIFGPNNNYMGYQGLYEVASRLHRLLRNPQYFQTLGRTAKLPYRASWYQADPFTYIRDSGASAGKEGAAERARTGIPHATQHAAPAQSLNGSTPGPPRP
jgi:nitrogenase molybdenum-iron protein alpha chain